MKNREIIIRRIEKTEGVIEKLNLALRRSDWQQVNELMNEMRELLGDAKVFINQEPFSPGEINTSIR